MPERNWVPLGNLALGWQNRADPSKIELGAALEMRNCTITDRDSIAIRPGTLLYGEADTTGTPCVSAFTHVDRWGVETPMRSTATSLEIYNTVAAAWQTLKSSFRGGDFGFADSSINTDVTDINYFCNGIDPYQRWRGWTSKTTAAVLATAVILPVVTTLTPDIFYTGTASASTDTTITIANSDWATNLWNTPSSSFYVRITAGAQQGKIAVVSATTATQITFTNITGLGGTVTTFEIRRLGMPAGGTVVINGLTYTYSVLTDASLSTAALPALASGVGVAIYPEEITTAGTPRGNRLICGTNTRIFVGGIIGNSPSLQYSKTVDGSSFAYSSPRVATDGGVIDTPEGGGAIKDVVEQEENIYILKTGLVKTLTFTQDGNDLPQLKTLIRSNEVGMVGRAFKVGNDTFFATRNNAVTSLGRLPYIDTQPRTFDVSYDVKKGISLMDFTSARGAQRSDKAIIACKETTSSISNDVAVVYNFKRERWEGIWDLDIADFNTYGGELYFASSTSKETYKMFVGTDKEKAGVHYPVNAYWKSGYINFSKTGIQTQEMYTIAVTGWIAANTTLTFDLTYDYGSSADTYSWSFSGIETTFVFGEPVYNVLGTFPLGVVPLGMIGDTILDNKRKFLVFFNVPAQQHTWFQFGWGSNDLGQDWEITDVFCDVMVSPEVNLALIKDTET